MTAPTLPADTVVERPPRNVIGIVAFVVGVLAVLAGGVLSIVQVQAVAGSSISGFGLLNTIREVLVGLLGLVALLLGVVGLLVRSPRKAFAASGASIGGVLLANLAFGGLFSLLLRLT